MDTLCEKYFSILFTTHIVSFFIIIYVYFTMHMVVNDKDRSCVFPNTCQLYDETSSRFNEISFNFFSV